MKDAVRRAVSDCRRLIFTDEAMFTTSTLTNRGNAPKNANVTIEEKFTSSPAIAIVAHVSAERGIEGFHM
jgi:hypothetical protein